MSFVPTLAVAVSAAFLAGAGIGLLKERHFPPKTGNPFMPRRRPAAGAPLAAFGMLAFSIVTLAALVWGGLQ